MRRTWSDWTICRTLPPFKPGWGVRRKNMRNNHIEVRHDGMTRGEAEIKANLLNSERTDCQYVARYPKKK